MNLPVAILMRSKLSRLGIMLGEFSRLAMASGGRTAVERHRSGSVSLGE